MTGEKVVAFCDRYGNILAPFLTAAGNRNESPLFPEAFSGLKEMALKAGFSLSGSIMSLDGVYDSKANRKKIFNHNMTPNIPENKRNRKRTKRGRKRKFDKGIFRKRFETIERCFAWEDKFKRLLVRFERISGLHLSLKLIAFTMINLRRHI